MSQMKEKIIKIIRQRRFLRVQNVHTYDLLWNTLLHRYCINITWLLLRSNCVIFSHWIAIASNSYSIKTVTVWWIKKAKNNKILLGGLGVSVFWNLWYVMFSFCLCYAVFYWLHTIFYSACERVFFLKQAYVGWT